MTWRDSVTPAEVVDLLNDLMRRDPAAMRGLFRWRVTCNTELALHPGVQVDATDVLSDEPIRYSVGLLGILNALFGLDEGKRGLIREVRGLASGLQKFTLALEYASTPPEQESREQLLARLEAAEAKTAVIGGEACIENRKAGRGPCGACAVCCAELRKELEEAQAATRALQRSVADSHEHITNVSKENEKLGLELHHLRVQLNGSERNCAALRTEYDRVSNAHDRLLNQDDALRTQLTDLLTNVMDVGDAKPMDLTEAVSSVVAWVNRMRSATKIVWEARPDNKAPTLCSEYDAKHLTPAQFMELAQIFFARRSVWTEDDIWVKERLSYVAHHAPGKFVGEGTARRMCEMALNPTSPSPAQRAKMEKDGKAEFLDVWLRELGEDREWLGCAGGPAFGPFGHRNWTLRTLRLNGFQKADLSKLQDGQWVVVVRDEDSEPMWVEAASHFSVTSDGTLEVDLGYYQTSESGQTRFTRFTEETYVKKTRGAT